MEASFGISTKDRIARHKTAIGRSTLSRPLRLALTDGILKEDSGLLDYGCGRGDDLRILKLMGFKGDGWDPAHRPEAPLASAPIVNIGYVVNVIEDPEERMETLSRAWALTEQILIVSARLASEVQTLAIYKEFSDGCLTSKGTFQKFFEQHQLKHWIDHTLGVSSVPAGPGIFYVFRDDEARENFLASRYRRHVLIPRLARPIELFEQNKDLLQPLIEFFAEHGRVPADVELADIGAVRDVFGSTKRAFRVIQEATDTKKWNEIANERSQDLMVYLALSRFDGRPRFAQLPQSLQYDVKSFFTSYKNACDAADDLLFSVGEMTAVDDASKHSHLGKKLPDGLYIHESALEQLPPILRIYEGCARGYIGRVEGANVIKLNRREPKITYLQYPDFESDPHPTLKSSLSVHLQTFRVKSREYGHFKNPPILHRKDTLLHPVHPLHSKFARLTRIEVQKGLYDDASRIGTRDGWNEALAAKGLTLRGHRLVVDR